MAVRLSVTITAPTPNGNHGMTRRSECQELSDLLERMQLLLQQSQPLSGTVSDRNYNGLLVFTYTPTASS